MMDLILNSPLPLIAACCAYLGVGRGLWWIRRHRPFRTYDVEQRPGYLYAWGIYAVVVPALLPAMLVVLGYCWIQDRVVRATTGFGVRESVDMDAPIMPYPVHLRSDIQSTTRFPTRPSSTTTRRAT